MSGAGRWATIAVVCAVALGHAGAVRGVTFLEIAGAPSSRHPFTARVWPSGPSSAYFNPCLLLEEPSTVLFGPFGYIRSLDVRHDPRPASARVPTSLLTAVTAADGRPVRAVSDALPTAALPRERGAVDESGGAFYVAQGNHTQLIPGRLALGFYLLLAGDAFALQGAHFVDERAQFGSNSLHFELLGDRLETVSFAFGLSGKPLEWLSLGAGIALSFASAVESDVYVPDPTRPGDAQVSTSSDLRIRVAPHFAVAVEPLAGLRLTSTVHLAYESDAAGTSAVLTRDAATGDGAARVVRESGHTMGSLPLRVALGASWSADDDETGLGWSVAATGTWTQWSAYRDRSGDRPAGWSDTFTVAVGGDLRVGRHAVGLDLAWVPSPVPAQDGRTNYVDNDRLGVAAGYDVTFDLGAVRLVAGVQLQFQALLPRHTAKSPTADDPVVDAFPDAVDPGTGAPIAASAGLQTNNPGYPGYETAGWLLGAGGSLRVQF